VARLWQCGFEIPTTYTPGEISTFSGTTSFSTTTVRTGAYSLRANPSASTGFVARQIYSSTNVTARVLLRAYIYVATAPAAVTGLMCWADSNTALSGWFGIKMNTDRTLIVSGSAGTTGTASAAVPLNTWTRIELDYDDVANTAAAYLDGVNWATLTGADLNGGLYARFGVQNTTTADIFFDDLAVNDTAGSVQNSLPGPGKVAYLRPVGQGDNNGFTIATGGTAGVANNYTRVNEVALDFNTTQNETTNNNTTTIDDFTITSATTAGISGSDVINAIQVGAYAGSSATSGSNLLVLRIKGQSSGTVTEGTAYAVENFSGYAAYTTVAPRLPTLTSYTNPQTGTAWTASAINTAQIGYRASSATTNSRYVSTLWATVDFAPSTGTTATAGDAGAAADGQSAQVLIGDPAGDAAATADAYGATAVTSTSVTATAGEAAASADSYGAAVTLVDPAGQADVAADALSATAVLAAIAGAAAVQADAYSAPVLIEDPAGQAAVSADAYGATVVTAGLPVAGLADATADAFNATATGNSSATAVAGDAAATADALASTAQVVQSAGQSAVSADAYAATVSTVSSVTAASGDASAQADGFTPGQVVLQPAGIADAVADAYSATVSTASSATATAGDATVSATAFGASATSSASALAGLAAATADAFSAQAEIQAQASLSVVGAAAFNATVVVSSAADAGTALATAQAFNATANVVGTNRFVIRPNTGGVSRPNEGLVVRPAHYT
jgi:hypothetical protein